MLSIAKAWSGRFGGLGMGFVRGDRDNLFSEGFVVNLRLRLIWDGFANDGRW